MVRWTLELLLERYGFQVALAGKTSQALADFAGLDPSVVLLDMSMLEESGAEEIVEANHLRRTKVIGMYEKDRLSAPELDALAARLRVDALIAKPFEADDLMAVLHDVLVPKRRLPELIFVEGDRAT